MIVEEGMGWNSRNYTKWKPYKPADRNYNWTDYVTRNEEGKVISCHSCDIRKTGCQSPSHPRYFCKKDKREIQMTLGDVLTKDVSKECDRFIKGEFDDEL